MSCPGPEQLAAAATERDEAILAHAITCAQCLHALDEQRALRTLVQRAPAIVLTRERREAMAAELMAHADLLPAVAPTRELTRERRETMAAELMAQADEVDASIIAIRRASRRRTVALIVASVAAAAAFVIVIATRGASSHQGAGRPDVAPTGSSTEPADRAAIVPDSPRVTAEPIPVTAPDVLARKPRTTEPRPAPSPSHTTAALAGTGDYALDAGDPRAARDVIRLRGGELTVDSTSSRPVEIVSGETAIAVKKARVKVIATKGVVSSVAVFAGSAQVTIDGHSVIVEAGTVWERDVARDDALAAFKAGWAALRAGDNTAAIAAFDRAVDPIVAEDAVYWSAIASERSGNSAGAVTRYRELLAKFPSTTRAAEARAAIERLAP